MAEVITIPLIKGWTLEKVGFDFWELVDPYGFHELTDDGAADMLRALAARIAELEGVGAGMEVEPILAWFTARRAAIVAAMYDLNPDAPVWHDWDKFVAYDLLWEDRYDLDHAIAYLRRQLGDVPQRAPRKSRDT